MNCLFCRLPMKLDPEPISPWYICDNHSKDCIVEMYIGMYATYINVKNKTKNQVMMIEIVKNSLSAASIVAVSCKKNLIKFHNNNIIYTIPFVENELFNIEPMLLLKKAERFVNFL